MLFTIAFLAAVVNAAVVQVNKARDARPGSPVRRDAPLESPPYPVNRSATSSSLSSEPTEAAILPVNAVVSPCTPSSVCFDGFSCGMRYGGCYDANYCNGNTSPFPTPTCSPTPANAILTPVRGVEIDKIAFEQELGDGSADAVIIS